MVGSSNDAAIVLAEHVAGSQEEFSNLMNKKAQELGCTNSHFINPNGVHNENHYSTAHDLAIIAKYAMQNDEFRKLVSTTSYKLPATSPFFIGALRFSFNVTVGSKLVFLSSVLIRTVTSFDKAKSISILLSFIFFL